MLATSNGHSGKDRVQLGSTSLNLKNSSLRLLIGNGDAKGGMKGLRPGLNVLVGLVVGGWAFTTSSILSLS